MSIRVLLVDDHAVVRDGLRALLDLHADFEVVGVAENGRGAVTAAQQLHPDVVVMDINMPEMNGVEACRRICEQQPATKVLILSMHGSSEHVYRALQAGARGFLLKEAAAAEVVTALRALHAGRRYLGDKIMDTAMGDYLDRFPNASPLESLSPREREILQLIVNGGSNTRIAATLSLSIKTIETYRSRLMQKLGMRNVTELLKFAIEHGLT